MTERKTSKRERTVRAYAADQLETEGKRTKNYAKRALLLAAAHDVRRGKRRTFRI